ncbi:MAG TPA: isoleucine--tRNA ligase [Gammaproteobacteria bacterium]|nr:isoleucine--tRNA ligase [Gammaproteobacteria bacterium]
MFEPVAPRYDGPALEKAILELWRREDVFKRVLADGEGRERFVFYEGPPTANGRPGIHHVLARTFKDLYPRFKTMQGYHCPRKAGWDTHGLPVEHEIEKELGIFDKQRIEQEVGIDAFVAQCRGSVMRYVADWEAMTERMGFWVDFEDAYYTLSNDYIESVWCLLKQIWDRGLIYQGYKVVPYDPRIGATLSSHEVALGYREVEDPSVYVRFKALDEPAGTYFLVWTTTPWTLPSNLLLAVHPDVDYVWARREGETLILARPLADAVLGEGGYEVVRSAKGSELDGMRYERLFDYLPIEGLGARQRAVPSATNKAADETGSTRSIATEICRVRTAEFVTTEDGTGIVHIAPAYGEDDLKLGQAHGLPVLHGVGEDGYFLPQVEPVAGKFFKEADPVIIDLLRKRGLLFREARYKHNYPFGWRTGDPLIYYAKNAWYIRTTEFRDRMVELNKTVHWVPENIRDGRFGNWLENNIDWALSRERFWGTPLPLWSDGAGHFICIGSLAELEERSGRKLAGLDLHRPAVDDVSFVHEGREYRRVAEVIDCWFDSGSMPYAQWHYPFENREIFAESFPADFICEAIDQTRGWFYTLHAIATMVEDGVAYKNVVCLSHIVDQDGKKMSKSLGNIVDPYEVFDAVGADALRWHFTARVAPDVQKRVSVEIIADVASSFINTLWNTYGFFVMYARLDGFDPAREVPFAARPEIDRWVLALLEETIETATSALERYDALTAGTAIERFVDQLSNWYIRRNRRRFWKAASGDDKQAAYLTLYECLDALQRLLAPFVPFLAEAMYQNIGRGARAGAPVSVHQTRWPAPRPERLDRELLAETEVVQRIVGLGRAARNESRLKVRQPLARLLVRVPDDAAERAVERQREQILEELNVKKLELLARDARLVSYRIKPNLPFLGKRYGKLIPAIREYLAEADGAAIAAAVERGETQVAEIAGQEVELPPEGLLVETESAQGVASAEEGGYLVGLDTMLNDALRREGLARELVRAVQEARKQAGLEVSDRILLSVEGDEAVEEAAREYRDYLMSETLASRWGAPAARAFEAVHEQGAQSFVIRLAKEDAHA